MNPTNIVLVLKKINIAYADYCRPICKTMQISQTAFDILMFLANNPEYNTAKDISHFRGIKPNLLSFTIDKLVQEGYVERHAVQGDRRKIALAYTQKAMPIIEKGRTIQDSFNEIIMSGISEQDLSGLINCMNTIQNNLDNLKKD